MAEFGYAVGDILLCAEKCFQIYQAITDSRKNAPRQVRLLAEEFNRFGIRLRQLRQVLIQAGRTSYQGHEAFKETLKECEEFVEKYAPLNNSDGSRLGRGYRTVTWTMEDKTVERLRAQVAGHVMDIIMFQSNLLMCAIRDPFAPTPSRSRNI